MRRTPLPRVAALFPLLPLTAILATAELTAQPLSGDWPQWRGPERSGAAPDFEPPDAWPEELELVWQTEVGRSDASPVIADGRLFAFVREDDEEVVKALDLATGEPLWSQRYEAPHKFINIVGEHRSGPFATPLVADGVLYTYGITEILTAWNAETGEQLWRREFTGEFEYPHPFYGNSLSPLLHDGRLILSIGGAGDGAITALDPKTGEDLWRIPGDGPSYSSPVAATLAGVEQIVMFTQARLVGVDPAKGELLWEMPYKVNFDSIGASPLVLGDLVIVSGYQKPTEAFRFSRADDGAWSHELAWTSNDVTMQYSSPVLVGDRLVTYSVKKSGQIVVLSTATGETLWEGEARLGENAFLVAQGEYVLALGDDATARLVRVGDETELLRSWEVAESPVWNYPALLGQHLVVKDWSHVRVWRIAPGT